MVMTCRWKSDGNGVYDNYADQTFCWHVDPQDFDFIENIYQNEDMFYIRRSRLDLDPMNIVCNYSYYDYGTTIEGLEYDKRLVLPYLGETVYINMYQLVKTGGVGQQCTFSPYMRCWSDAFLNTLPMMSMERVLENICGVMECLDDRGNGYEFDALSEEASHMTRCYHDALWCPNPGQVQFVTPWRTTSRYRVARGTILWNFVQQGISNIK